LEECHVLIKLIFAALCAVSCSSCAKDGQGACLISTWLVDDNVGRIW
jgi:hypothetical protein